MQENKISKSNQRRLKERSKKFKVYESSITRVRLRLSASTRIELNCKKVFNLASLPHKNKNFVVLILRNLNFPRLMMPLDIHIFRYFLDF